MKLKSLLFLVCFLPLAAIADEQPWYKYDHLYLQGGSYAHFGGGDDDYDGPNIIVSLEAIRKDNWLGGLALFDNSFGQFSQYLFIGKNWDFEGKFENFHAKLTAGIIHGYKDKYKDKIPFNDLGIGPGLVPSFGYKKNKLGFDIGLLGDAGAFFTVGYEL